MLDGRGITYEANSDGERTIHLMPEAGMGADNIQLVAPAAQHDTPHQMFSDTSFQDFANPEKVAAEDQHLAPGHVAFEQEHTPMQPAEPCCYDEQQQQQQPMHMADSHQPSEGYVSLQAEVADLSFKLERLRKKGLPVRTFEGSTTDLRDMRAEYNRIKSEIEFDNSMKFGKKALCGVVSVIEWLNQKYQPFDLQLEGWSESVMTGIDGYENTLERLITKYRHRVSAPPEVELALSLAASGLMYHMTNTMFKQALHGGNPDLLKSMVGAFTGGNGPQPPAPPPAQQPTTATRPQAYKMRGPGIDLSPLMTAAMQQQPSPMPYPQPANPPPPTRLHPNQPSPITFQPPPQQQQQPMTLSTENILLQQQHSVTPLADGGGDRLSDINSEDMQSIRSIELDSIDGSLKAGGGGSISSQQQGVRSIHLTTAATANKGAATTIKEKRKQLKALRNQGSVASPGAMRSRDI